MNPDEIPKGWKEVTVEDLKAESSNALATGPFGSSIGSRFFQTFGVPVIRGSNLSQDIGKRLIARDLVFLSEEKALEFERSKVKLGDLIFTCWGTIDQVGLIDERSPYREYIISNKQMKVTPNPEMADSLFLYYLFSSPEMTKRIKNQGIGSSVPGFNLGQLRSMRICLPPLPEQRAIAHIIGTLDNKIELNRRMNVTLEVIACTIFKSWFVDFDPVWAKAKGREPTGMDAETAALFPDSFEETELGMVPKGWQVGAIGDIAVVSSGKRPAKRESEPNQDAIIPLYGGGGPMAYVDIPLYTEPIILTGRVGTLGMVFRISFPCWPSDNTLVLLSKRRELFEYLYFQVKSIDFGSMNRGSTQPLITQKDLKRQPIVISPDPILEKFHDMCKLLFNLVDTNFFESNNLIKMRDTLLPKLLSGEIRVKYAGMT